MSGCCPHCRAQIFATKGEKAKLRTNILVVHKSGAVETNCPSCKKSILLPMEADLGKPLRKSAGSRFVVPLDRTKIPRS